MEKVLSRSLTQLPVRNGFIFGPQSDLTLFVGSYLIAVGLGLCVTSQIFISSLAFGLVSYTLIIDGMHSMSTNFLAYERYRAKKISGLFFISAPFLVLGTMISIRYFLSPMALLSFFAYATIWHIYRQQHGWVRLSRAKAKEKPQDQWLDDLFVAISAFYPLVYWHSPYGNFSKDYYSANDLVFTASQSFADLMLGFYILLTLSYLAYQIYKVSKGRPLNFGKYLLIFHTWLMFFPTMVLFASPLFLTLVTRLSHSIPYIKILRDNTKGFTQSWWPFIVIFGLVMAWSHYFTGGPDVLPRLLGSGLPEIVFFPILLHIYYDAFLWKRDCRK